MGKSWHNAGRIEKLSKAAGHQVFPERTGKESAASYKFLRERIHA